jgi:hypothetical protein
MDNTTLIESLKKDWFTYEEIQSVLKWLNDVENWNTISYENVKKLSREKIFHNQNIYV